MGSAYQFPLSPSSSNVREPSFSLYLNSDDKCSVKKLAELTRSRSEQNGRVSDDGEISVFTAAKYFNEGVEVGSQKQKLNGSGSRRCTVEKSNMAAALGLVRSKVSLGTPSIRSESSWHSQSALLRSFPTQVPGRRSTGEMHRMKSLLSNFSCKCSCATKKSLKVNDQNHKIVALKEPVRARMNRADQLLELNATLSQKPPKADSKVMLSPAKPSLLIKGSASPVFPAVENPSPKFQKSSTNSISLVPNTFDLPAMDKTRRSISHERIVNLRNRDSSNPLPEDVYIPSAISVEYYTDAESDASSDLFEIDSFTGNSTTLFSGQIQDIGASGYATPSSCYAPSEASIDWSVITASVAEYSMLSECEEFKPAMPETNTRKNRFAVNENHLNKDDNAGLIMNSIDHKEVRLVRNTDFQKTEEIATTCHQRLPTDQFTPFSRYQIQAHSSPQASSRLHSNKQSAL